MEYHAACTQGGGVVNRRKKVGKIEIHPEELMHVGRVAVDGVYWTGIFLTAWWFLRPNYGPQFVCALSPRGDHYHRVVVEHIERIRRWLRDNDRPEIGVPVDGLFIYKKHLWRAFLETHRPDEVKLAASTFGPLGRFRDDVPGSPFGDAECKAIMKTQREHDFDAKEICVDMSLN